MKPLYDSKKDSMRRLRFLYLSRNKNRSGFVTLNCLLGSGLRPDALLVPKEPDAIQSWVRLAIRTASYRIACLLEGSKPLRALRSEVQLAKRDKVPVFFVQSWEDEELRALIIRSQPDLLVIGGGWPGLIPDSILSLARLGAINLHPSLLPSFRGTSITRWQTLAGIELSGVTIHSVNSEFDRGKILARATLPTATNEPPQILFERLAHLGAELMTSLVKRVASDCRLPEPLTIETEVGSNYFPRWKWDEAQLEVKWHLPFENIHRHVLANAQESYRFPGPWFFIRGKKFFLRRTTLESREQPVSLNSLDSDIQVFSRRGKWVLERSDDPHRLVIDQIQAVRPGLLGFRAARPGFLFRGTPRISK